MRVEIVNVPRASFFDVDAGYYEGDGVENLCSLVSVNT